MDRCIFLVFLLFCGGKVQAQLDTTRVYELQEVQVEGQYRPQISRTTAPVQVMTDAGISRLGVASLSDAIRHFSGVTVKDYGGIGGLKTVSIRSLGSHHTAVSYDGVAISNCQSGQIDISRFSVDNVSKLSLYIGQQDELFQSARMFASAGGLCIESRIPQFAEKRNYEAQVQLKGGSFGFVNPSGWFAWRLGQKTVFSVTADYLRADGIYPFTLKNGNVVTKERRVNSDISSWRAEANMQMSLTPRQKLSAKFYYFDSERGLPGAVILYNPYTKERLYDLNYFVQLRYENQFNEKLKMQVLGKYNYSWSRDWDFDANGIRDDRFTQTESYVSSSLLYSLSSKFSFSIAEDFSFNDLENTLPECQYPQRYSSLTVAGAQFRTSKLKVTANLLYTYITERVDSGEVANDRKKLSPTLGMSYQPFVETNLHLRAFYKNIFRVPTFNDMYYKRIGNANLKPESATQYNLGITWTGRLGRYIDYLNFSVDAYYNKVKDKIVAIPTMFIWKMMNVSKVEIKGIDVNLSGEVGLYPQISFLWTGTYTYQKALDVTDRDSKLYKNQIPYTPEHSGSGSFTIENPWLNVTYNFSGAGIRYALSQNIPANQIKGYFEHGISANRTFQFRKRVLRLSAALDNLGDKNYDIVKYYPMTGRSYRLSVAWVL